MTTQTNTDTTTSSDEQHPADGWFVRAHVDQLLDNPADPRGGERDQATLIDLAGSIGSVGLLQALTVIPTPDAVGDSEHDSGDADGGDGDGGDGDGGGGDGGGERFVIYAGHRRRDAARLAAAQLIASALGHDITADPALHTLDVDLAAVGESAVGAEVIAAAERLRWLPCLVRPDLAAELGMDVAAGLVENDIRRGLTTGQRARSAEQLSLTAGWNPTRVAAATGLSRTQARAAAALPRLGDSARQAAYRGELSLEHAAILDEIAAEGATDDEIGLLARGGTMFEHHVSELRKTLRRRAAAAALRDEAELRGWVLFDEPDGYPLDSTLAPLWSLSRAEAPDAAALLPRHGEDADPTASRLASPYAAMPDHGVLLHDDPWEEPHLEVVCADPETWGYRRDPHSTLYVAPEPTPDSAGGIVDAGDTAAAEPGGGDQPDTAQDGDHRPGHADPEPGGDTPSVTPDEPVRDADDSGAAGEDGAAEADTAAEQARAAREAENERRRAEAAEQEQQRRAEAAQEAAQLAAENERLEAERAAEQARRDALETAADTRWRHTAGLLRTQKGAAGHAELPAAVMARFPWLLGEVEFDPAAEPVSALCAEPERDPTTGAQRWSPGRITHRAVVTTAWVLHHNLTGATLTEPSMIEGFDDEAGVWWLDYLTARGYQPAEVETEVRDLLEQHVTHRLAVEYGAGTGEQEDTHSAQKD